MVQGASEMTGYDINAYLKFTRRKLTRDPFNAAIKLAEKGRMVLTYIDLEKPVPGSDSTA
jgi:hypothetical protein